VGLIWGSLPKDHHEAPMTLTVTQIKNAKPKEKPYKLVDEHGLYVLITPNSSKLWKLKYRFAGIEKKLSFGSFSEVSLAAARELRKDARAQLADKIDPGVSKNSIKRSKKLAAENSFEAIAREWHSKFTPKWTSVPICYCNRPSRTQSCS
jgi:hypothetical protein